MGKRKIGLVAAMPEEIKPLLRRVGEYRRGTLEGFNRYDFEVAGKSVTLLESGMGPARAARATRALVAAAPPECLINFGFAGAVTADTAVGELVLAEAVYLLEEGRFTRQAPPDRHLNEAIASAFGGGSIPLHRGTCITAAAIVAKAQAAQTLPPGVAHPVLEMETAAVCAAAREAGVPAAALRAISDGAEEELGFSLEEFCDAELNIRLTRVLATVARKPWIIPQLLRLAGNTKKAGEKLAEGMMEVLSFEF